MQCMLIQKLKSSFENEVNFRQNEIKFQVLSRRASSKKVCQISIPFGVVKMSN